MGQTDFLRAHRFALQDLNTGRILGLAGIGISPAGPLTGQGVLRLRAGFRLDLAEIMSRAYDFPLKVWLYDTAAELDSPTVVVMLRGVRNDKGKVEPIELDATSSDILMLEGTLHYDALVVVSGNILERMAVSAG